MSGMIDRLKAEQKAMSEAVERATRQYDTDTLHIALARYEKLTLGYQRIMEITELWEAVKVEYSPALGKGVETDVYRYHMDEELKEIAKDGAKIIPFEKRYPELQQVTYGRKRKH